MGERERKEREERESTFARVESPNIGASPVEFCKFGPGGGSGRHKEKKCR